MLKAESMNDIKKNNVGAEGEQAKDQGRAMVNSPPAGNSVGKPLSLTPFEEILLEWSVATVGRSWSVIADILRSYPLASGQQFDAAKVAEQYIQLKARKKKYYHKSARLEPTESDGLPILGRFKPYLLMNRMLPVYPQQYMLACDYLDRPKTKEEFKLRGKRRMRNFNLPSEYEIRELKYKCTYDVNPLSLLNENVKHGVSGRNIVSININNPSINSTHSREALANEGLASKSLIYQLAKIIPRQEAEDPITNRKEQLKSFFRCRMEIDGVEIKAEHAPTYPESPFTSKVLMNSLLENLFVYYQDIFKYNWNAMINAWYQNHRSIALYTRKPSVEHDKSHQPKSDHTPGYNYSSSLNYQKGKPRTFPLQA